ncbi:hypothetical protein Vafri_13231, partial [Volvox africanus]
MVLLGGDLFHENKPSRSTLVKAIQLLSKYCLNDRPVRFRILSDQSVNFVSGRVNFENPNLNVGLPLFTIHGNHDDPSGQDSLSAVDILSQTGLVNYFGKHPLVGSGAARITLSPVLIEKGSTRLCLYGLGNIRDERLGRSFQTPGCVQWQRPAASPGYPTDCWINMFVLHQNRVQHTAFAKACVREEHLPPFLDLAVWGHEHECRPDPVAIRGEGEGRYVVQPGSTVATALSEGESRPKHSLLLEVKGTNFRLQKFRLRSVRPFEFETVALRDVNPALKPEDTEGVTHFLTAKIQEMITRAATSALPLPSAADGGGASDGPLIPLIRLRVDYTGFSTVNSQRLGQRFVGKVANPHDMLQWSKAPTRKVKGEGGSEAPGTLGAYDDEEGGYLRPEALDQSRIEDLIRQHLGPNALEVLPDDELAVALHNFVEKDDKNALQQCIEAALEETRNAAAAAVAAAAGGGPAAGKGAPAAVAGNEEDELLGAVRAGVERRKQQRQQRVQSQRDEDGVDLSALEAGITQGGGAGTGAYGGYVDEHMADVRPPPPAAAATSLLGPSQAAVAATTGSRGRGRGGRGGRQQSLADSLARASTPSGRGRGSAAATAAAAAGGERGPLDAFLQTATAPGTLPAPTPTPAKGRGARATTTAAATAARAGRGRGRGGRTGARGGVASPTTSIINDSDVEMADDKDDDIEDMDEDHQQQKQQQKRPVAATAAPGARRGGAAAAATTPGRARSTRAAAGASRKNYRIVESDDEDDEEGTDISEVIEDEEVDPGDEVLEDEDEDAAQEASGRGWGRTKAAPKKSASGRGRGRGAMAAVASVPAPRSAAGASRPLPRGSGRGTRDEAITLTSDEEDDEPAPSLGPPVARAHAAAGAAFVGLSTGPHGTITQGGAGGGGIATGAGPTPFGTGATAASGGGRKRPASFFTSGSGGVGAT